MSSPSTRLSVIHNLIMRIVFVGLILMPLHQTQAMSDAHQQGMLLAQGIPLPQPGNPDVVPGYAGPDLPQSQLKAHDLSEAAQRESQRNEGAQIIAENVEKGGRYVIDPHTDPLILAGNEVINNPQKTLDDAIIEDVEGERGREEGKAEVIVCEEAGNEYTQICTKRLEIVLKITPETSSTYYVCGGHKERRGLHMKHWTCGGCVARVAVTPKKVEVVSEKWTDGCTILEGLTEQGLCRYENKTTSAKGGKPETRTIQKEPISRDHFEEYYEYSCLKASVKSCAGLRERGCYQINSVCKAKIANTCVLWEQTYRCPPKNMSSKSYCSSNKDNPFCLSGDCINKSYEANRDFAEVMSHMSVLKEAGEDLRNFGAIFKGVDRRCTRHCVDFKDCCGNGNGWGVSLKLASCDADEKELAELRKKKRCIQVGTYCAEKVLGVCIRKKTSFCCYGTKLAKIVQEQGKGQLGLGFGSAEHPQCQGLTADQLSKIDFSRINFSDIFADITANTKVPNPQAATQGIQKSMANKGSLIKPTVKGLQKESTPSIQPQPSVTTSVIANSRTGNLAQSDVPPKPSASLNIAPNSLRGNKEHAPGILHSSTPQPGNHQIQGHTCQGHACQGRNHGEF